MLKLITLLLTSTMTVMAGATIAPALPQIQQFFQEQPNADFWVKLMLTIPALFTAISGLLVGTIIDRFGSKKILAVAVFIYGIAGATGCYLSSLTGLLVGRAFLGMTVAAIMTASVVLIASYYQDSDRDRVMGIQASFMGFGGVAFLSLGGILADLSWRGPFYIYLCAFGILPLVIFCLREPKNTKIAKVKDNAEAIEKEKIPLTTIGLIYGLMFLTMVAFYLIPTQIPFYLTKTFGVNNSQTGMAIACCTLSGAIVSMGYGWLKKYLGFTTIAAIIYVFFGSGYLIIAGASSYSIVIVGIILSGVGTGLLLPNMNVWINAVTPAVSRGKALGGLTTAMFLGQFSSPIISDPVADRVGLGASYGVVGSGLLILAVLLTVSLAFKASRKPKIVN